jgi:Xaa-Pro aminopeptidase
MMTCPQPSGYPAFSGAEMTRRRDAIISLLGEHRASLALVYGFDRSGSAVPWLTGWPVTREAALLLRPGERDVLFVSYDNHVPNARRLAPAADVRPGGGSALATAMDWLAAQGPRPGRLAVIGPVPAGSGGQLTAAASEIVFLDAEYTRLRLVKPEEEIAWLRRGAQLSDDAVAALAATARPGMSEPECCASLEGGYVAAGGQTQIHYLGATPMARPGLCVPAQWPSARRLAAGDVLSCEVSASYHGYPGQLLRTFTVAAEPTPLYRQLHDVAEAAFDAVAARIAAGVSVRDLARAAAEVILGAGYTIYDDLLHGYGGGYLPPVLRRADLEARTAADFTLTAGMTVVIQPNVITRDEQAGVQTGELVLVTPTGWESLHRYPRGLRRIGG